MRYIRHLFFFWAVWSIGCSCQTKIEFTKQERLKGVRLHETQLIRRVCDIKVGEGPLWVKESAIFVDTDGYMWLKANAHVWPDETKEACIQIRPGVKGFKLTFKVDRPTLFIADTPLESMYPSMLIRVIEISTEMR